MPAKRLRRPEIRSLNFLATPLQTSTDLGGKSALQMFLFFGRHERHAQLPLRYPDAAVLKDTMSYTLVDAYQKTFRGPGAVLDQTVLVSMSH